MQNLQVDIKKGRNGWEAATRIELSDNLVLIITTDKRTDHRGAAVGVESTATVHKREGAGHFLSHSMILGSTDPLDGDFRKELATAPGKCTETNVRLLHGVALNQVDALLPEIAAFYKAKAARVECAKGIHSWADEQGKLPPDTKCAYCDELYGHPN